MCDEEMDNTDSDLIHDHVFPIHYPYDTSQPWLRMTTSRARTCTSTLTYTLSLSRYEGHVQRLLLQQAISGIIALWQPFKMDKLEIRNINS